MKAAATHSQARSALDMRDARPPARVPGDVSRLVIGLPTRNEVSTVRQVVAVAEAGLHQAGWAGNAVLINADNDSTDGTAEAFRTAPGDVRRMTLATGATGGKGTNVLAIFHAALELGAERLVLLDADVRSAEPWWVPAMLRAVDAEAPAMAVPVYRRNRYEGNTTNHIASPLVAAVLGVRVQQPIAGDFAFNRRLLEHAVSWPFPESAQLYGIDIHLTASAARDRHGLVEVPLGRKIHNPGFPKILYMSQQVIDSAFHAITRAGRPRHPPAVVPGPRTTVDAAAMRPDATLVEQTLARVRGYLAQHREAVACFFPSLGQAPWTCGLWRIDAATWAEVLADALEGLAAGHAQEARDHLVALYLCRVMTYWEEIDLLHDLIAIDKALDAQTEAAIRAVSRRGLDFTLTPPMTLSPGAWRGGAR
jgi:hypothetical protein